jgi:hypothetical protein
MARPGPVVGRHPSLASLLPERGLVRPEAGAGDRFEGPANAGFWEAQLDRLAERVFGGVDGAKRAAPLLARWDAEVGRASAGDADHAHWQAARIDWALCDAEIAGGGPGETWAWRAAHGCVPEVEADAVIEALARSQVGLFELWPGRPALLRGRIRGLCLRIDDPSLAPVRHERGGPLALWEVRVVFTADGARMCRPPIGYPLEILPRLQRAHEQHWREPSRGLDLPQLRRMRLQWTRARKPDPRGAFG